METVANTISASRVPAVLGLDRRCSPLTLFLRLRGVVQEEDLSGNEAVREGIFYERATADICCAKYGMEIIPGFEQRTMHDGNLSGHPDFVVRDEHGKVAVLEVKNPFFSYAGSDSDDDWGEPGTDEVPRAYLIQAMIYQELLRRWAEQSDQDLDVADYSYVTARLRGGVERYVIGHDPDVIAAVRQQVDLMLKRVADDEAPDPRDEADMRNRWAGDPAAKASCDMRMVVQVRDIKRLGEEIKRLQKEQSEIKASVLTYMRENSTLEYRSESGGTIDIMTAKPQRSFDLDACWEKHRDELIAAGLVTIDTKALQQQRRSLYESFMRVPTEAAHQTRPMRVSAKGLERALEELEASNG